MHGNIYLRILKNKILGCFTIAKQGFFTKMRKRKFFFPWEFGSQTWSTYQSHISPFLFELFSLDGRVAPYCCETSFMSKDRSLASLHKIKYGVSCFSIKDRFHEFILTMGKPSVTSFVSFKLIMSFRHMINPLKWSKPQKTRWDAV